MRDRQEVLDKFRELSDRYFKEFKGRFLSRIPINCTHNVRIKVKDKGQIGLCQNPLVLSQCGEKKMFACTEPDTACRCRLFTCKHTESSVEENFKAILKSPSRCGKDYPKLAMLIWFLQDYDPCGRYLRMWQAIKRLGISFFNLLTFRWW